MPTKEVRKSLVLMMRGLPRLQPEEERGRTLLSVASLIKHLDHDEIKSLSSVAAKIADQEPTVESGDDILRALSPLLARYKSLHLGRQLAERIFSVDGKLETFTALLDVYLREAARRQASRMKN